METKVEEEVEMGKGRGGGKRRRKGGEVEGKNRRNSQDGTLLVQNSTKGVQRKNIKQQPYWI